MKMFKKTLIAVIIILSVLPNHIGLSKPIIEFNERSVKVEINSMDYELIEFNGIKSIQYNDISDNAIIDPLNEYPFPEIRFSFAVPDYDMIKFDLIVNSYKEIENNDNLLSMSKHTNLFNIKADYEIMDYGSLRGLDIAHINIKPIEYFPLENKFKIIDSFSFEITFDKGFEESGIELHYTDLDFLKSLNNYSQLTSLLTYKSKSIAKKQNTVQADENWYEANTKYLRISTNKDAIAKIPVSHLVEKYPELLGKESKYLHLIHNGEEHSIGIIDSDGSINTNDMIMFLGQIAYGDTTWFDTYTQEENYFLYYDNSSEGLRLSEFDNSIVTTKILTKGRISQHIEVDTKYEWGDDISKSPTAFNENWYWKILLPGSSGFNEKHPKFDENISIDPSNSDLSVNIYYKNIIYANSPDVFPHDSIYFSFNGRRLIDTAHTEYVRANLEANNFNAEFISGMNNVDLRPEKMGSLPVGYIGVDFITIEGEVNTSVFSDVLSVSIDKQSESKRLHIYGFKSSEVSIIDTISNEYYEPYAIPGNTIRVGAVNSGSTFSSLMFNDSSFTSHEEGYHLLKISSEIEYLSTKDANEVEDFLNSLKNDDYILAAINIKDVIPTFLISKFQDIGAENIIPYQDGFGWVYSALIGNDSYKNEDLSRNSSSISNFYLDPNGDSYRVSLNLAADRQYHFIANSYNSLSEYEIYNVESSTLRNTELQADVIYLTHRDFEPAAEILAEYRRETTGFNIKVINIDDVYKEFGFGRKSPHSIKEFLRFASENWQKPTPAYLGIWGDASWDSRKIRPKSISYDFIPSYGNPVSDYWYGLLNNDIDELPEIKVGRITAKTLQDAMNFVNKAIEYDTIPIQPWNKKFLLLSGGITEDEREDFYDLNNSYFVYILNDTLCADTITIQKRDPTVGGETEAGTIRRAINEGVGWVNFFGHAAAGVFDMDGWQVSKLLNTKRYPFFSAVSCNTGAFAEPDRLESRNESYVIAKDIGFVTAFGSSGTGFTDAGFLMYMWMLKSITRTDMAYRRSADILYYAKQKLFASSGFKRNAYLYQFNVMGDPLTRLRIGSETDLFINPNETYLYKGDGSTIFNENDSTLHISAKIYNNGYRSDGDYRVRVIHKYLDFADTNFYDYNDFCGNDIFSTELNIKGQPGSHSFSIMLDADSSLSDVDYINNYYYADFDVFKSGLLSVDPFDYWDVSSSDPKFRYINPLSNNGDIYVYQFRITQDPSPDTKIIYESKSEDIIDKRINIDFRPDIDLIDGEAYWMHAKLQNVSQGSLESSWLTTPIFAHQNYSDELVEWKQFKSEHFKANFIDNLKVIDDRLELGDEEKEFKIVAVNGIVNDTIDVKRWINIEVGNDVFVDSQYERGFNVVVLSARNDGHPPIKRRYDTWADEHSTENLVLFLRDSVDVEDYVLIGTCDQSFRAATELVDPGSVGELDSVRAILKEYGSQYADSLTDNWSYAMVGRRGAAQGEFPEMVMEWDSAMVTGNLRFLDMQGEVSFRVGPAKEWNNYEFDLDQFDDSEIQIDLYDNQDIPELIASIENEEYDLSDLIDTDVDFINAVVKLKRHSIYAEPKINAIAFDFKARPEIALDQAGSGFISEDVLRGNDAELNVNVNNIAFRSATDEIDIETSVQRGDDIISSQFTVASIGRNSFVDENISIETDILETQNQVTYALNYNSLSRELYAFNNSGSSALILREDTTKPEIVLKADGQVVQNFDFIGIRPFIEVEVYDNSNLLITDPESIEIRINSKLQNDFSSEEYKFESINTGSDLKLRISFIPDTLNSGSNPERFSTNTGDNLFKINVTDNSGNSDTVKIYANVSINNFIMNDMIYPNPIEDNPIISFDYVSQNSKGKIKCFIYNSVGQIIKSMEIAPQIGENVIYWDARDENGNTIPSGIYLYKLVYTGDFYAEPAIGKMIKI